MYRVVVETSFSAIHRVRFADGSVEPAHGHDWKVCAHFARLELDENGFVVDFELALKVLKTVAGELHHQDLNAHAALNGKNPSAENIARYFYEQIREKGLETIRAVHITEAPGCTAVYEV